MLDRPDNNHQDEREHDQVFQGRSAPAPLLSGGARRRVAGLAREGRLAYDRGGTVHYRFPPTWAQRSDPASESLAAALPGSTRVTTPRCCRTVSRALRSSLIS